MVGKQITAQELNAIIISGTPETSLIIDVRTPGEFMRGKIAGAINIPVDQILNQLDSIQSYKTIYLYCLSGFNNTFIRLIKSIINLVASSSVRLTPYFSKYNFFAFSIMYLVIIF